MCQAQKNKKILHKTNDVIILYSLIVTILFCFGLPFLLLAVFLTGKHRHGLGQRFGLYQRGRSLESDPKETIWLHASSVGEVQAARFIIEEVRRHRPRASIVLTLMTVRGLEVARRQLGEDVICLLAPLDVPGIVDLAIAGIRPDIYICLETELWPVLFAALARRKVRMYLANGRISAKSHGAYRRLKWIISPTIRCFHRMAVISTEDRRRFIALGASPETIRVTGNVKYDLVVSKEMRDRVQEYKEILDHKEMEVFVAGSTHGNEELMLLDLFGALQQQKEMVFLIAPRHLERLEEIERAIKGKGVVWQTFSALKSGLEKRREKLVLIDTMGELSCLYGLADYIFCGGSLVNRGGHNIMEAAVWGKAVFYGPYMADFQDAAAMLEAAGGGFPVADEEELRTVIMYYRQHNREYREACRRAGEVALTQQESGFRQIEFLFNGGRAES